MLMSDQKAAIAHAAKPICSSRLQAAPTKVAGWANTGSAGDNADMNA
jgi:hypothetical protein